jgi:hypothetical protein
MSKNDKNICIFSVYSICDTLNIVYNSRNKKFIIDTLILLQNKNKLCFRNSIYKNDKYIIDDLNQIKANDIIFAELIESNDDNFFDIYDDDIQKIVNYSTTTEIDLYSIIKQYVYINNNMRHSYIKLDDLCFKCNIKTRNTVIKYNNIFRELEIFDFKYFGHNKISENKYKIIRIYYGMHGNNNKLNDFICNEQGEPIEILDTDENEINFKNNEFKIYNKDLEYLESKGLYLIRNLDNNTLKIGICNNLSQRFKEIKRNFKFCGSIPNLKIECFVECKNNFMLEQYLHKEFKEINYQNEWFNIDDISIVLDKVNEYLQKDKL